MQGRDITSGGLGVTNNRARSTSEATRFWVKYKGNLVTINDGADGYASSTTKKDESRSMFWRAVRLTDAPTPTILVSTTHFWMITEENGALVTKTIESSGVDYQWLDADKGQPTEPKFFGIENVTVTGTELRGGRWLRMNLTVLDVSTLRLYSVYPFIDSAPGSPLAGLQASNSRAFAFSPAQTQYVTYAGGVEYQSTGQLRYSALMVVDISSATSYALSLIRTVNRYYEYKDLTPEWLAHYFQWTKNPQGVEKLSPRADAKVLPWIGRVNTSIRDEVDYRIAPVSAKMVPVLAAFMVERMGAQQGPGYDLNHATFTLPGRAGAIKIYHHDKEVLELYADGAGVTDRAPPECHLVVAKIGEAFNVGLRSGLHQALFINE